RRAATTSSGSSKRTKKESSSWTRPWTGATAEPPLLLVSDDEQPVALRLGDPHVLEDLSHALLEGMTADFQRHARQDALDPEGVLADVLEGLQAHFRLHDLFARHLEAVVLQQLHIVGLAQAVAGHCPRHREVRSKAVLLLKDAQGLHHPAAVEDLGVLRLTALVEGSVEGELAVRSQGQVDFVH